MMFFFSKVFSIYRSDGIQGLASKFYRRLFSPPPRAKCYSLCRRYLSRSTGLEIGGPSGLFSRGSILPVYPLAKEIDNCNFANNTTWQPVVEEGMTFRFDENRPMGRQYIFEATNLFSIPSAKYDFLLSSHVIEHIANPLRALGEWKRVLKEKGFLVLIVPHKEGTFDRQRPVTTFEHIFEDFERKTGEEDLTHLPEILKFHDLKDSVEGETFEEFKRRSERNFENRCLHHHAFDTPLVAQILNHMELQILAVELFFPCHIIAIARKIPPGHSPDNSPFLQKTAEYVQWR